MKRYGCLPRRRRDRRTRLRPSPVERLHRLDRLRERRAELRRLANARGSFRSVGRELSRGDAQEQLVVAARVVLGRPVAHASSSAACGVSQRRSFASER